MFPNAPDGDQPPPNPWVAAAAEVPVYVDPAAEFRARLSAVTPKVFVTFAILAINIVIFIAMAATGVAIESPTTSSLLRWGADFGPDTITQGQWWRMLSSMFIHIGLIHLAFNMFVLFQIGVFVERLLGNAGFFVVYMISGIAGALASLAWNPYLVSAGASGAIFGLYGALLGFFLLSSRDSIPIEVLAPLRQSAMVFIGYNVVFGFIREGTDVAAHAGGLAGGFLCGLALALPLTVEKQQQRIIRDAVLAVAGVALAFGIATSLPRPVDLSGELDKFSAAERKCLGAYNTLIERIKKDKLGDDQVADVLEKEILPEWEKARAGLSGIKGVKSLPPRQQQIVYSLVQYAQVRQEAWSLFAKALRSHSSEMVKEANAKQRNADLLASQLLAGSKKK